MKAIKLKETVEKVQGAVKAAITQFNDIRELSEHLEELEEITDISSRKKNAAKKQVEEEIKVHERKLADNVAVIVNQSFAAVKIASGEAKPEPSGKSVEEKIVAIWREVDEQDLNDKGFAKEFKSQIQGNLKTKCECSGPVCAFFVIQDPNDEILYFVWNPKCEVLGGVMLSRIFRREDGKSIKMPEEVILLEPATLSGRRYNFNDFTKEGFYRDRDKCDITLYETLAKGLAEERG